MSEINGKRHELPAVKFTKAAIDRLPLPAAGRVEYRDEKTPALRLRITANGKRTFSYYGRVKGGRVERITIGPYPMGVTIDQARDHAQAFGEQMAAGKSSAVPRHNSTAPTVSDFLDVFLATKRNKRGYPLAARTQSEYRATADRYLGRFLKYRLHELKREHVAQLHSSLGATAPFAANRLLAMPSSVYHFAQNDRGFDVANPTTGIRKFPEDERDRVLDPAELQRLWRALDQEESDFGIVFKLALLTGRGARTCSPCAGMMST